VAVVATNASPRARNPFARKWYVRCAATGVQVLLLANRVGVFAGQTGGGSLMRAALAESLRAAGHSVEVAAAGSETLRFEETIRGPMAVPSLANLRALWNAVGRAEQLVLSGSFNPLGPIAVRMARARGTPTVTVLTMDSQEAVAAHFRGGWRRLFTWLYCASDAVCGNESALAFARSAVQREALGARGVRTCGVLTVPAQYAAFRRPDSADAIAQARRFLSDEFPERPLLLYAGRLIPEKRVRLLVDARPPGATLAIVGEGSAGAALARFHDPANGVVVRLGRVPQDTLRTYYRAADLHVSASSFETFGNTVHESLLCGTPVVVQRAGGYLAQVDHGANGYLVDYDDVEGARQAIRDALDLKLSMGTVAPRQRDVQELDDVVARLPALARPTLTERVRAALTLPALALFFVVAWIYWLRARVAPAPSESTRQRRGELVGSTDAAP
jgi:glycosyltransferase involved in cell wall biosynthesis